MADLSKPRVVAVGGPTASGKTALSVALARAFDGEIINADSMQIYKNLDVGTAKPSAEERQGIPHYLLDFLSPETPYSVADFTAAADPLIRDITARGRLPLVVGGTGLYITSLLSGMAFAPEKTDPAIRARLQARADTEGGAALCAELQRIDPDYAAQVHPNNLPRVIRALELFEATGRRMSDQRREARPAEAPYHALTNGGHISYIEMDGDPLQNLPAFEKVVRFMGQCGIGYGSINHPVDRDPVCGFNGIIGDTCPRCGRRETPDQPFERIRSITGYLVGTLDRFNNGKRAEERDRVKHGVTD